MDSYFLTESASYHYTRIQVITHPKVISSQIYNAKYFAFLTILPPKQVTVYAIYFASLFSRIWTSNTSSDG